MIDATISHYRISEMEQPVVKEHCNLSGFAFQESEVLANGLNFVFGHHGGLSSLTRVQKLTEIDHQILVNCDFKLCL